MEPIVIQSLPVTESSPMASMVPLSHSVSHKFIIFSLSLSFSLKMARGMLFLILLIVLLVHETWSAKDGEHCTPSCGNIQNISYPFALKGDPKTCGDPRYRLSCENNQTVLHLYAGKYNVQEINYTNFRIRVSDSGIQENDNHSFIPHYFLRNGNFTPGDPYAAAVPYYNKYGVPHINYASMASVSMPAAFVNCEKPAISPSVSFVNKVNISACFINSSKGYRYILFGTPDLMYVEDTCQVEQIFLTTEKTEFYPKNSSCSDVHNDILVYGFELSWHQVYCGNCTGRDAFCYLDYANNVVCDTNWYTVQNDNGAQKHSYFAFAYFFLFRILFINSLRYLF
jgi:hypothetical protein